MSSLFSSRVLIIATMLFGSLLSQSLLAQNESALTDKDVQTYLKLRLEYALASERTMHARQDQKKIAEIEATRDKALKESGWTQEKYGEVDATLSQAVGALTESESTDAEVAKTAKETLAEMDKAVVELARKHRKELQASASEKASEQVRTEAASAKLGAAPDAKSLEGTWKFDIDLTAESAAEGMGEEMKKTMRDSLAKTPQSSYTFGPGNSFVSTTEDKPGSSRTEKATYRVEGNKIYYTREGSSKERSLDAGIKNGNLIIRMMGVHLVYKK